MQMKTEALTLSGTNMTSNITSDAVWLGQIVNLAIQVVYTGAGINGSFKLQGSCDAPDRTNPTTTSITNWTDVTASTAVVSAGSQLWNLENVGYNFVRLVWTDNISTAGTITVARVVVKGA